MPAMIAVIFTLLIVLPAFANETTHPIILEDFSMQPETRWRFFTDQVMGGVSSGRVSFIEDDETSYARMTGSVSTANRGGFIQMRIELADSPPANTTGIKLSVRGNNQRYFVHIRTGGTLLPWQYYQAGFDVTEEWTEINLPLDTFKASGSLLRKTPKANSVKSIAVVAFGRDHEAQIDVREVGFY